MAVYARSGYILGPLRTGTGTVSLGFRPRAIIVWADRDSADGASVNGGSFHRSVGFVVERSNGTLETLAHGTGLGGGFSAGVATTVYDVFRSSTDATFTKFFRVTSLSSTGFSWEVTEPNVGSTYFNYGFLALGGTDMLAAVRNVAIPAGAASGTTVSITDLGFTPKALVALPVVSRSTQPRWYRTGGIWVASRPGRSASATLNRDPTGYNYTTSANANIVRYQAKASEHVEFYRATAEYTAVKQASLQLTAMNASAVEWTLDGASEADTTSRMLVLAIGGATVAANVIRHTSTSGSASLATSYLVQPKALVAVGAPNDAATMKHLVVGFGAAPGPSWSATSLTQIFRQQPALAAGEADDIYRGTAAPFALPDFTSRATPASFGSFDWTTGTIAINHTQPFTIGTLVIGEELPIFNMGSGASVATGFASALLYSGLTLIETAARPVTVSATSTAQATGFVLTPAIASRDNPAIVTAGATVLGAFGVANSLHGATGTATATATVSAGGLLDLDQLLPDVAAEATTTVSGEITPAVLLAFADAPLVVEARSAVSGYTAYIFPRILPSRPVDIPGTINLVMDPGYESGVGWVLWSGALTATNDAWTGAQSARWTASTSGQLLYVETMRGIATRQADTYVGSLRVRGTATGIGIRLEAVFTDGTVQPGDAATVTATSAWSLVELPTVTVATDRTLDYLRVRVASGGAATLDLDGVQVELGQKATAWCSGALGDPSGTWLGVPNASPSWRQTVPYWTGGVATPTGGRGGALRVEAKLYRATYDNRFIEDLSEWVVSGQVTMDTNRDVTWSLDATLLGDGWERLTPYLDWVAPYLTVTFPDGSVSQGQLGLYLVMDSPVSRSEYGYTVQLMAMDPLWLLGAQGLPWSLAVGINHVKTTVVRQLLEGAVLTRSDVANGANNAPRRYLLPTATDSANQPAVFSEAAEFEQGASRLSVINDILLSAGCSPLYTTRTGMFTTRRLNDTLASRSPVRTYAANAPAGYELGNRIDRGLFGDVISTVETTPIGDGLTNEILLVNDRPDAPMAVRYRITDSDNYRSFAGGSTGRNRRATRMIANRFLDHPEYAAQVARALAESLSLKNRTARVRVVPEPHLDLGREVVGMAVFDADGRPAITGKWYVERASYGFTPSDAWMELDLAKVYGVVGVAEVIQ